MSHRPSRPTVALRPRPPRHGSTKYKNKQRSVPGRLQKRLLVPFHLRPPTPIDLKQVNKNVVGLSKNPLSEIWRFALESPTTVSGYVDSATRVKFPKSAGKSDARVRMPRARFRVLNHRD
ncbi:hypothetical protein EVAR_59652_1 [Eumeta japonica]|uniref:Uncharacterized protein n=1 Tax=Eumeta variegata TaxID=151549 RepID=A0A4C1SCX1_EUMVA|nr:hypothetical protein EVAR_59652_1 [Eumeta japonica]